MKASLKNKFFSGGHWTAVLAAAALLAPAARAQFNMGYEGAYTESPSAFSSAQSIGTRQAQAATTPRGPVAQPGMSPVWFGIASAMDAQAALGQPDQVLAVDTAVPALRADSPADSTGLQMYQMRIQASANALDVLEARSVQFSGDTQTQLRDAMREADVRRTELEHSLAAEEDAGPHASAAQRSALADNYLRYSEAAARVEQLSSS